MSDLLGQRHNTGDNTPAVVHVEMVAGDAVTVTVAAKGGGSENKSRLTNLAPAASVADWVVSTVETLGAGWCPPGLLGIGVGGSVEKSMVMAKEVLLEKIDMPDLIRRGPSNAVEELRLEIYDRVNALGIGAQGLGGLTTVVDVKVRTFPCHAASKPVGLIPQCAADRYVTFKLDGSGPAELTPPDPSLWPVIAADPQAAPARRVDLDRLTREEVATWRAGETVLLSGRMLTGRDAAHKRMADLMARREPLPVDLRDRAIYYVGPVDAVRDEAVGPARPDDLDPHGRVHRRASRAHRPACHDRQGRAGAPKRSAPSPDTAPPISSPSGARPIWCRRPSGRRAFWPSPISAWRRSTNSWSRTCPSRSRSTVSAPPSTRSALHSGKGRRSRAWGGLDDHRRRWPQAHAGRRMSLCRNFTVVERRGAADTRGPQTSASEQTLAHRECPKWGDSGQPDH